MTDEAGNEALQLFPGPVLLCTPTPPPPTLHVSCRLILTQLSTAFNSREWAQKGPNPLSGTVVQQADFGFVIRQQVVSGRKRMFCPTVIHLLVSWCFKPSQPQRIISVMRETFIKRYIIERTNEVEIRLKEQSEKAGSCRENLGTEIQLKRP